MSGLMLLNPKGRKSAGRRKRRKPMTAKQLKYFGPRKSRKATRKRRAAAPKVVVVASNPRRKRRTSVAKKARTHRKRKARSFNRNPRPARRRFRRNPLPSASGFLTGTLVPAGIGAGGALLVDLAIGNLPLPASAKQGAMLPIVRIAGALGVGALVGLLMGEDAGQEAAAGGIVVTLYAITRQYLNQNMPNIRLARYVPMRGVMRRRINRFVPMRGIRANMQNPRMGKLKQFRRRRVPGMGAYVNPARVGGMGPGGMTPRLMTPSLMRYVANR